MNESYEQQVSIDDLPIWALTRDEQAVIIVAAMNRWSGSDWEDLYETDPWLEGYSHVISEIDDNLEELVYQGLLTKAQKG